MPDQDGVPINMTQTIAVCEKCGEATSEMLTNGRCSKCITKHPIQFRLEGIAKTYNWKNIDDEDFRAYVFPGGDEIVIEDPLYLHVSESGGHRLFDARGFCHYVPSGWIHIYWMAKKDEAHFRF